ncbi:MAG: hypothetical protein ACPLRY_07455 [Candidatus Bathyarchaeales archaeon]
MSIEKRKALILLSTVVVAAVISGIALNAYSTANANTQTTINSEQCLNHNFGWAVGPAGNMSARMQSWPRGGMRERGYRGFIEVSDEFKENVINIAKSDTDVQNLLNEGYNITGVRPIIKTVVERDGTVVSKATSAVLMLEKNTTGCACVWVDLEQGKVVQIEILTRAVIEKP